MPGVENQITSAEAAIEAVAREIETQGDSALAGAEMEVLTLRADGTLMPHQPEYQSFLRDLILETDADAALDYVPSLHGDTILVGARTADGTFCPETSSTTTEFATDPVRTALDVERIIGNVARAFGEVTQGTGYAALAAALPPGIRFSDIRDAGAAVPHRPFAYSYGNITSGAREEVSLTSFGNASIHNNQGFSDPEAMARFTRVALHMQPTMIALTANSPLWDNARAVDGEGRRLLSRRSWLQTNYERFLGYSNLEYLYPSFMLDWNNSFGDIVRGYMRQPLDRSYVNGEKISVGKISMEDYARNGFNHASRVHYPDMRSLNMMFSEPMVDVRMRAIGGARVETRAHEAGAPELAPALNAFYRGIAANLDAAEHIMRQYPDAQAVRAQRLAVCYTALATPVSMADSSIKTQQHLALRLLSVAHDGLTARALGEERLLSPLHDIAWSGHSPAERQVAVFENECGGDLRRPGSTQKFMEAFRFARPARMAVQGERHAAHAMA